MNKFPAFPPEPATNYWPSPKALNGWWHILSGSEQKCLDFILRHTCGFKKTSDRISYEQFLNGVRSQRGLLEDRGCGFSRPTLSKALKGLTEKGFIEKHGKERSRSIVYSLVKKLNQTGKESLPEKKQVVPSLVKKLNTQYTIKDISIIEIWNFYLLKAKTKEQLLPGRKKKMVARVKKYSSEQIKQAITNCFNSPFHLGKNDRGWIANADYIFKSDE